MRFFAFFFLFPLLLKAEESLPLSKDAKLSLITCGQGESPESAFGHSALRVVDSAYGIDVVFNYGSFNYSYAEFYYHFVKGDPIFYLTIVPTPLFLEDYRQQNRGVIENEICIDSGARHETFKFLMWNAQERNYAYGYNIFTNNCATKIMDVLRDQGVSFQHASPSGLTYRKLLMEQLSNHGSYRILLGTLLGMATDEPIAADKAAFLPGKLRAFLSETGTKQGRLLGPTYVLVHAEPEAYRIDMALWAGTFLLFVMLSSLLWRNVRFHTGMAFSVLFISGLLGVLLAALWMFTDNAYLHKNWNLLWAVPANIVAAWFLIAKPARGMIYVKYYGYYLLCAPFLLLALPQGFYYGIYAWLPLLGLYLILAHRRVWDAQGKK